MTSTSSRIFTGFVPESIISGIAAGQGSGKRYRSLLLMKRTTGFADQRELADVTADLRMQVPARPGATLRDPARVVPVLYRRKIRTAAKAVAEYVGVSLLAVLYGTAFAAFGFYVSLFLDALGVPEYWQLIWMLAWVAAGSVAGTVWLLRYAGIDVRRRVYRGDRKAGSR